MGKQVVKATKGVEGVAKNPKDASKYMKYVKNPGDVSKYKKYANQYPEYVGEALKRPDEFLSGLAKHEKENKPTGNQTLELGSR